MMLPSTFPVYKRFWGASKGQLTRQIKEQHCATQMVKRLLLAALVIETITCAAFGQTTASCGKLNVSSITASTDDGNLPSNAIDGNLATRWSGLGVGAYLTADLGSPRTV